MKCRYTPIFVGAEIGSDLIFDGTSLLGSANAIQSLRKALGLRNERM
jgi:hypothetical protein